MLQYVSNALYENVMDPEKDHIGLMKVINVTKNVWGILIDTKEICLIIVHTRVLCVAI